MKGGIQKGTTSYDEASKTLDSFTKEARAVLASEFEDLILKKKLSKEDKEAHFNSDCVGCSPDGGLWYHNGKLVAAFEAKKQGRVGNAHERWYDNATTTLKINPNVRYITFCVGDGAKDNGGLEKMARKATECFGDNFKFYLKPDGFTFDKIKNIMREELLLSYPSNQLTFDHLLV